MSASLLAPCYKSKPVLRLAQVPVRTYAARNDAPDPKREIIRKALYPSSIRSRASPTSTWRPDVARALQHAVPSVQVHETIERAWKLHRRHVRRQREAELSKKFESMRKAMTELERVDSRLYMEASKQEDPRARTESELDLAKKLKSSEVKTLEARIRGLFPRELRIPTDTPSHAGWNYDWRPFPRPL